MPKPKKPRRRIKSGVLKDAQETPVSEHVSVKRARSRWPKGVIDDTPVFRTCFK